MLRTLTILCGVATGVALPSANDPANDLRSLLFGSFRPAPTPCPDAHTLVMTTQEVLQQQKIWGDTVVAIGAAYTANPTGQEHIKIATDAASNIYAYDHLLVMFKPTLASDVQFRPNPQDALSYFVGHSDHIAGAPGIHMEDTGFAVKPWSSVVFHNHGIYCSGDICHAMGVYDFTDANINNVTTVEYTFGYKKFPGGNIRIFLHHSSLPFQPAR